MYYKTTMKYTKTSILLYCTSATIPKSPFSPTSDLICCRLLPRMWWQKIGWAWQQSTQETLSLQQCVTDQILWCDCCGSNLSFICFQSWQLHWDKEIKLLNYNRLVIAQEHRWRGRKGEFSPSPTSHPTKSMQAGKSIAVKNISTTYCA